MPAAGQAERLPRSTPSSSRFLLLSWHQLLRTQSRRGSGRCDHADIVVVQRNPLSRAYLAGLAQLDGAIHRHHAAGDERLAGAAAVAQPDQFQQLVELDIIVVENEI